MSESASQESESNDNVNSDVSEVKGVLEESCLDSLVSESDVSEKSKSNSSVSKIARPSGLKLPGTGSSLVTSSRIARLCNNALKPNLPSNQNSVTNGIGPSGGGTMSTPSSIRKISEDLARKRLTDADEADENRRPHSDKWTYERKMSSGSALSESSRRSSPDSLGQYRSSDPIVPGDSFNDYWKSDDFDGHRSSDASIVLTENTDQFIIGDRVWVGGIKPGQIAYIGETQFAPGEWAGVVLDDPIGKNDGTVANIRYFQCEPKKGIFSRLTRLTKHPLLDGGAGEPAATRSLSSVPEPKKNNGTIFTSVPKKSLVLTPTSSVKNVISKPLSPDSSAHPNLTVGDRVIVKSSQGSKAGILRYIGTTDFAAGEWCGVELDDPLGKNDGSVSGTRYFECRPKFGLFAPLHKVSKSPANKRLFQPCMIHPGRTGSTLRKQGSKESLVSMSSTASTTASVRSTARKVGVKTPTTPRTPTATTLQETLKKKEQHIEQLLKERDLERAEVTRAAGQADEAERQLACLKKEFEKQRSDAEARISDLDALVCLLKSEKKAIISQLDDERKKYEDLQFRFEEETIDKSDIKATLAQYEEKLNMLQKTLVDERKRVETLEHDSNKLFEAEEQMVIIKDEFETTKEELQAVKKVRSTLEQKHISLEAHLTSARAEIESLKIENQSLKTTAAVDGSNLKEQLTTTIQKFEEAKRELNCKHTEIEQLSKDLNASNEKEKELHAKYLTTIQNLKEKHKTEIDELSEDIKSCWESKLKILEVQLEEKINRCKASEETVNELNVLLSKSNAEKTLEQGKQKEMIEKLEKQLKEKCEELQKNNVLQIEEERKWEDILREKDALQEELSQTKNKLSTTSESTRNQVLSMNDIIDGQKEQLDITKKELEVLAKEYDLLKQSEIVNKEQYETRMKEMNKIVEEKDIFLEKMKEDFDTKIKEVSELHQSDEESFQRKIKQLEQCEGEKKTELDRLIRELETCRNSLEARESEVKNEQSCNKNLTDKLLALEENYRKISDEKDHLELEVHDTLRKLQSAEEKVNQLSNQKAKLEADILTFMNSSNDSSTQLSKLNEDLRTKEKEIDALREQISEKSRNFEHVEQELKQKLEKQKGSLKDFVEDREREKKLLNDEIVTLKDKIEMYSTKFREVEEEWMERTEKNAHDAEDRIKNLEEKIRNWEKRDIEERNKHENQVKELMNVQNELQKEMEETNLKTAEMKKTMERKIEDLNAERTDLLEAVEKNKAEFLINEQKLDEKSKKETKLREAMQEELTRELKVKDETLESTMNELIKIKEEKNELSEEKSKLEKANADYDAILKEVQRKNKELEENALSTDNENRVFKETINQLREEKCHMEKEVTDKMMKLTEVNAQLKSLEKSKKLEQAESEVRERNLEEEIKMLQELLKKTDGERSEERAEKSKRMESLEREIQKFKDESSQIILGKEKMIESVNVTVTEMKTKLEESTWDGQKKQRQIDNLEKSMLLLKAELEVERTTREEYAKRCNVSETSRKDLEEKYEEQAKLLASSSNLASSLAETQKKLMDTERREQESADSAKARIETLENMLEGVNNLLKQKEKEATALLQELDILKQEKTDVQKVENLKEVPKENRKEDSNHSGQMDDREFEKGQVDFLNSVIVDMQKKNDALKARIEILEMGYSPEDVEEFNLHNINVRSVAPRLFCDICDRFDLHDTEDCPTQATEDEPPPKSYKVKVPPLERPYCDICEVFGHETADCDDAETF